MCEVRFMGRTTIPEKYSSILNIYETQDAIGILKRSFEDDLSRALNLKRVSAPLFVDPKTGLNDNLNGYERPVSFEIPATGTVAEVVHSLAKWKRMALYKYGFKCGEGLYTDMNAIRRDEDPDNLHSVYVDQWDWEKVISDKERNKEYLEDTVRTIVAQVAKSYKCVKAKYDKLDAEIPEEVHFITSEELLRMYPDKPAKERERLISRKYGVVFIEGIGGKLSNGEKHDGRAPDYDDWDLNGDIIYYNKLLDCAFELSSMAIRVNSESLERQLKIAGCWDERHDLTFHRMLLANELPQTIGGGIGQSRICMLLLGKAHIGEVQSSIWDKDTIEACEKGNIKLL